MLSPKFHIIFYFLLLLFCQAGIAFAQNGSVRSIGGYFGVDYVKGCAPLTVSITEKYGEGDERNYRWRSDEGDFIEFGTSQSFVLPKHGVYYITQNIVSAEGGRYDSIRVEVHEPRNPGFTVENCGSGMVSIKAVAEYYDYFIVNGNESHRLDADNNYQIQLPFPIGQNEITLKGMFAAEGSYNNCGEFSLGINVLENLFPAASFNRIIANQETNSILLEYNLLEYVGYALEVQRNGTGNFNPLNVSLSGTKLLLSKENFPELNIKDNFYCFRIRTRNPCNTSATGALFLSDTVCTAKLYGTPVNNGNNVSFRTGPVTGNTVSLFRDGTEIQNFGDSGAEDFLDTQVNCKTQYTYAISIKNSSGSESITEGLSLTPEISGSLPPVENISSRWENGSPFFQMLLPSPPEGAKYYAWFANSERKELAGSSQNSTLKLINPEENSCFSFSYTDACENISVMRENICALYLSNNTTQPDVLELSWNEYKGYADGVSHYEVAEYDQEGNLIQKYSANQETTLSLGEQPLNNSGFFYIVKAYPFDESLEATTSNELVFNIIMKAYFPNAFSPNGDGVNENFKAEGKFVTGGLLEIYNRWGALVFKTREVTSGWDGIINGSPAQPGTYIYKANIDTEDGKQESQQGTFILIR